MADSRKALIFQKRPKRMLKEKRQRHRWRQRKTQRERHKDIERDTERQISPRETGRNRMAESRDWAKRKQVSCSENTINTDLVTEHICSLTRPVSWRLYRLLALGKFCLVLSIWSQWRWNPFWEALIWVFSFRSQASLHCPVYGIVQEGPGADPPCICLESQSNYRRETESEPWEAPFSGKSVGLTGQTAFHFIFSDSSISVVNYQSATKGNEWQQVIIYGS